MSNDEDKTKPDMTRIEDLSDYLHEPDPETDAELKETSDDTEPDDFQTMSVDDLEDAPPVFEEEATEEDEEDEEEEEPEETTFDLEEDDQDQIPAFGEDENDSTNTFGSYDEQEDDDDDFPLEEIDEIQEIEEEAELKNEIEDEIENELQEDLKDDQEEDEDHEADQNELPSSFGEDFIQEVPQEFTQTHTNESVIPTPRENFKDINEFGNAISYGPLTAGGNPPFSIILRKIKYIEDGKRIIEILREHKLCDDSNEADYQQGLTNGSLLISQLNEYSAIYLSHRFRRFDLEILVGLADEIRPSKNYDMDYKGLVRKENLRQNKDEEFSLEDQVIEVESILISTTAILENYRIERYLGLVSTHSIIDEEEFQKLQDVQNFTSKVDPDIILEQLAKEESDDSPQLEVGLEQVYQSLAEALKVKAFKLNGNAVVGINYQITPLIGRQSSTQAPQVQYKISCMGNAVWVSARENFNSEA